MTKQVITPEENPDVEATEPVTSVTLVEPIKEKPAFIDLIKFTQKDASLKLIKDKRAEYDKVTIDGVEDKANYAIVVANMSQMRDDRRVFENAAYDNVIDPIKDALKDLVADIDEVVEEFKAGELAERTKKNFIDDEKKRIKKEKEEAKAKEVQIRIADLIKLGGLFDGQAYSFEYDTSLYINSLQVNDFEDEEFAEFLQEVREAYAVEQQRLEDVETLRLQQEKDAADAADLVSKQAEQNAEDLKQLNEKRTALRVKELKMMGAIRQDDDTYLIADKPELHLSVHSVLMEYTDEVWDELILSIENYVAPVAVVESTPDQVGGSTRAAFGATVDPQMEAAVDEEELVEIVVEAVNVSMKFSKEQPFTDTDISKTLTMRFYPEEYATQALDNIEVVANQGMVQGLNWIIIKK